MERQEKNRFLNQFGLKEMTEDILKNLSVV